MNLRLKILLYIILTTAIIFIASVGFVNYRYWQYSKKTAIRVANLFAKQSAITAQSYLYGDYKEIQALEHVLMGYSNFEKNQRKEFYNQILKDILENNKNLLAVWTSWELNAVDAEWNFPYGRERTVVFWEKGNVRVVIDSTNLNGDLPGSPYFIMKSGVERTMLTNPYFYSYTQDTGSTFLETSLARGIYSGDKFVGAVGVDVSLERFKKIITQVRPFENSSILIVSNDGTIVSSDDETQIGEKITKAFPGFVKQRILEKIKSGRDFSFYLKNKILNNDIYYSFYPIQIEGSNLPWSLGFFVSTDIIIKDIRENSILLGVISLLSLLLISLIIWTVLSIIIRPIEKTTEALKSLSLGVISDDIMVKYKSSDELGIMAEAVNKLIKTLAYTQEFAYQIGQNNLKVEYELLSENDSLGKSLIDMRNNLFNSKKEELQRENENKQLNWLQQGITQLNEILRDNNDDLHVLSYELIKFITKYTNSAQGGFYLLEKHDSKQLIVLKSAYAFDRKKEITAEIEIGEGLVGRAVNERRIVNINNLPNGYLQVRSGLGNASPSNLVIIPLMFEDVVLGALELAGFSQYDDFKVDFLQQISVRISSSVSVLVKNLETEKLLKESQLQTATFEMKERQFVRSRKRIAEQKKEANIQKQIVDTSFKALRTLGIYIELDTDKTIIETNDYLPQVFEVSKDEIIGKKIEDISSYIKGSKIWIQKFWQDVFNGVVRKKITVYSYNNKEIKVSDNYFLIKDIKMDKVLIIGLENKN